jgi:prepilin-type N-terminal cleavage/methylation domain-containing protein/prepilin-type processing-associated H-X9-DG protein
MAQSAPDGADRVRGVTRSRGSGFTLIELLVVIGVVALLASVLMPAVHTARRKAAAAACASNIRQIHQAVILFAHDHEGRLPVASVVPETPENTTPEYQRLLCWINLENGPGGGIISFEIGGLWQYLGGRGGAPAREELMNCPADRDERSLRMGQRNHRNFSYSLNSNIRVPVEGSSDATAVRLAAVASPAEKIMVYEELGPNDAWCILPQTNVDDLPSPRHGSIAAINASRTPAAISRPVYLDQGLGNYCFFDGHVEQLTPRWVTNPVGRNRDFRSWGPLTSD